MNSFDAPGIAFIVLGVVGVSMLVTLITGTYAHWVPTIVSIIVGLWAADTINH